MKKILTSLFLSLILLTPTQIFADDIEDATEFYNQAIDFYNQDEMDKSIEFFTKAIELNPDFYEANYNLAQVLMTMNKNEEALKVLEQIVKLKPNDSEALYNIGKIQYKRGYLSNAHSHLVKIAPEAPQYESAKILIEKIEKRQLELNLESKIKETKPKYDPQGKALPEALSEFDAPSGIVLDSRGNIFIASFTENKIYKISTFGQKTTAYTSALIKGPIGIAIDKDNNAYISSYSTNTIVKITPQGVSSVFAKVEKPYCITYDPIHNRLYVTEQGTNKLVKFDL